jgi:hypothetical protein
MLVHAGYGTSAAIAVGASNFERVLSTDANSGKFREEDMLSVSNAPPIGLQAMGHPGNEPDELPAWRDVELIRYHAGPGSASDRTLVIHIPPAALAGPRAMQAPRFLPASSGSPRSPAALPLFSPAPHRPRAHETLVPASVFPFRSAVRNSLLDRYPRFIETASMTCAAFAATGAGASAGTVFESIAAAGNLPETTGTAVRYIAVTSLAMPLAGVGLVISLLTTTLINRYLLGGRFQNVRGVSEESAHITLEVAETAPLTTTAGYWATGMPTSGWLTMLSHVRQWQQEPNAQTFSAFLAKLHEGAMRSLRNAPPERWPALQERVQRLMSNMIGQPALRRHVFQHAEDALGNCHDRPPITLIDLELIANICATNALIDTGIESSCPRQENEVHLQNSLRECRQFWRKTAFVDELSVTLRTLQLADDDPLEAVIRAMAIIEVSHRGFIPDLAYPPLYGSSVERESLRSLAVAAMHTVLEREQANDGREFIDFILTFPLSKEAVAKCFPLQAAQCDRARAALADEAALLENLPEDEQALRRIGERMSGVDHEVLGPLIRNLLLPPESS